MTKIDRKQMYKGTKMQGDHFPWPFDIKGFLIRTAN